MDKWEYLSILLYLDYEDVKRPFWYHPLESGEKLTGVAEILNVYGALGWELVSKMPEIWETLEGGSTYTVTTMSATFKRRLN